MKIGDEIFVHGYVDEIRQGVVIIRNEGGYFGTVEDEIRDAPSVVPTQTNANQCVQRVEYIGDIEKKRCRTCKHFESEFHTPISSDGTYYPYVVCTAKECHYESEDERIEE